MPSRKASSLVESISLHVERKEGKKGTGKKKREKGQKRGGICLLPFLASHFGLALSNFFECLLIVCKSPQFRSINTQRVQDSRQEVNLCLVCLGNFLKSQFKCLLIP